MIEEVMRDEEAVHHRRHLEPASRGPQGAGRAKVCRTSRSPIKWANDVLLQWDTVSQLVEPFRRGHPGSRRRDRPPRAGCQGVRESAETQQKLNPHHAAAHRREAFTDRLWPELEAEGHKGRRGGASLFRNRQTSLSLRRRRGDRRPRAHRPAYQRRAVKGVGTRPTRRRIAQITDADRIEEIRRGCSTTDGTPKEMATKVLAWWENSKGPRSSRFQPEGTGRGRG